MRYIIDTREEHGGSRAGVGRLSPKPELFSTELLGCEWRRRATPIDRHADHTSKPYYSKDQPMPTPMSKGVQDGHVLPSLHTPP